MKLGLLFSCRPVCCESCSGYPSSFSVAIWKTLPKIQVLSCVPSVEHGARQKLPWVGRTRLASKRFLQAGAAAQPPLDVTAALSKLSRRDQDSSDVQTMEGLNGLNVLGPCALQRGREPVVRLLPSHTLGTALAWPELRLLRVSFDISA